jgi:catechol 2,3-dioxygenase-like lactoylglutathione lyase family enzyme
VTAEKFGGVKKSYWEQVYPEERFPGRGYVPQAFTHGTLVSRDMETSKKFYTDVLNLEVHRFSSHVIYIKHPGANTFIVCALRENPKIFSPNFRNTLTVGSSEAVKAAYDELRGSAETLGVRELFPLQEHNGSASFCFRDPGTNCWEISST